MCALSAIGEHALCQHPHPPVELVWRVGVFWQSCCPFWGGDELLWDSLVPAQPDGGDQQRGVKVWESWVGGTAARTGAMKEASCLWWDHSLMGTVLGDGVWECPGGNCPLSPSCQPCDGAGCLFPGTSHPVPSPKCRGGLVPFPGTLLHTRTSLPGSFPLQPVGGMGHGGSEPLDSSSLSEALPPTLH